MYENKLDVLEDENIAFNPLTQHIDLSKEDKLRVTALFMAINAYSNIIIKDADYLREANNIARNDGTTILPATMEAMITAAIQFESFLKGNLSNVSNRETTESK